MKRVPVKCSLHALRVLAKAVVGQGKGSDEGNRMPMKCMDLTSVSSQWLAWFGTPFSAW